MLSENLRRRLRPSFVASAALLVMGALAGCGLQPPAQGWAVTTAGLDTADTRLGKAIAPHAQAHPGLAGVIPLGNGRDAFASRALLADAAQRTLDVQYYIWRNDMSGRLLFEALHRAADRGVRVRLLLDDNNTSGLDPILAALDAHPHIEVRLFNPFVNRRWRALGYLNDFSRLNRRMHNKSFTADNLASIIGGRNVGDEYFDAGQDLLFVDLDVLAVGPVVSEVSRDFDRYWSSPSAYPVSSLLASVDPATVAGVTTAAALVERNPAARAYVEALAKSPFVRDLLAGSLPFEWAPTRLVSDDPAKGLGQAPEHSLLLPRLKEILGTPTREVELVSPYFVPTAVGVQALAGMTAAGVKVSVLTNSLEATDVAVVHAGYAKRRKAMLEAGIRLFEMKRSSPLTVKKELGLSGSSASSLHAKTFAVDGRRVFVGSFNFDPRSARLNTEMGFVIDSPNMGTGIADAFARRVSAHSYEVRLGKSGALEWVEQLEGQSLVHEQEPGTSWLLRSSVWFLSLLPIEWML
ncbi:Phosphatidylserine/phosphatidylglycerophosphate/cardiolipin synthase [Polaromonas sp. OV174]|uniref:phospholipase D family protein n=1 Tax=Polaromonas sp. OV174 TaxID=1855300 RepID=UPI0008EDF187|nr:phospholipase D family protein [Polaromonas sp. OV174]SFB80615.1 Phosphatidylserine/phosphatidylglycerophosphate/cardiolipin synthase [Polaromonas sp. OV174]